MHYTGICSLPSTITCRFHNSSNDKQMSVEGGCPYSCCACAREEHQLITPLINRPQIVLYVACHESRLGNSCHLLQSCICQFVTRVTSCSLAQQKLPHGERGLSYGKERVNAASSQQWGKGSLRSGDDSSKLLALHLVAKPLEALGTLYIQRTTFCMIQLFAQCCL